MKNIKLISIVIALVLLVVAPLAAEVFNPEDVIYKQTGEPFMGTNTRVLSMGGAGLGVKGYYDSFLMNPANLAGSGFKLSIPAITMTVYNPKAILESGAIEEFEKGTEGGMVNGATSFLGTIRQGYGDLLTTDSSIVLTLGGFGIALEAQERIMTHKIGVETLSTKLNLIAQVTTAATVGFGLNFNLVPDVMSMDIGVSGRAVYKLYLQKQNAKGIIDMIEDGDDPADKYLNDVPLAAGYALPLSAGINFNFPFGLRLSTVARNFNGKYSMEIFPSVNNWAESVLGSPLSTPNTTAGTDSGTFEFDSGWKLDAGLTWAPNVGSLIKPIIAIDVLDVMSLSGLEDDALARGFFEQTRLGASVRLLSFLDVRYGINKGYQSIGVGLDLLIFHLDAAYYQLEYGQDLGDKPIDALSVRFSLISR